MKKRAFFLISVVISSYISFMILLFPMNLLVDKIRGFLPSKIVLESLEGTLFDGDTKLIYSDKPMNVGWKLCPFEEIRGVCLKGIVSGIDFNGVLKLTRPLELKNWRLLFELEDLKQLLPNSNGVGFFESAKFDIFFRKLLLDDTGRLALWDGVGKIEELKLPISDDTYTGDLVFAEDLSLSVILVSGTTSISGTLVKTGERTVRLDAIIETELSELHMLLNKLCQRDANGKYKCQYESDIK